VSEAQGEPYSGRLILDHFPKTAGQAVNRWLTDVLGNGTVSPNLKGLHKELISYGGRFPVLTGHIDFIDGEGLDPRYRYATIIRDPLDRAVSWLFFVTKNHSREQLPDHYDECEAFLSSDGHEIGPLLRASIANPMVNHYAKILGAEGASDQQLVRTALEAISSYDCIGLYEGLSDFVRSLASLIGIPAPEQLQSVNATAARPETAKLSQKLRRKLLEITELDRDFYARVAKNVSKRLASDPPSPPQRLEMDALRPISEAPTHQSSFHSRDGPDRAWRARQSSRCHEL
jgi:hypothetical protein